MGDGYPRYEFYRFRVGATHHTVDGPELVMDLIDRLAHNLLTKPMKAKNDGHHYVDVTFTNKAEEIVFLVGAPTEFRILRGK